MMRAPGETTIHCVGCSSYELRVESSLDTDKLVCPDGKRIRICGIIWGITTVTNALTSTLRATLCFGTGHTTDKNKIICSGRICAKECNLGLVINPICLTGNVNEDVVLTNMTYSIGNAIVRTILFYKIIS